MDVVSWVVPVAVAVAFALFRWLVPAKVDTSAITLSRDELQRRYRKWEVGSLVPLFGFAALFGYGWFLLLRTVASLLLPSRSVGVYVLVPEDAYWALPALFLGIVCSVFPMVWIYKKLLGERYAEYEAYGQLRVGFNAWAVFRVLAIAVPLAAAAFVVAGINYTTVFDERGVTTKTLWGSDDGFHAYSAITSIRKQNTFIAPNGNVVHRPHYVIVFTDGTQWTTRDGLRTPLPAYDTKLMQFVAEKSGRMIEGY